MASLSFASASLVRTPTQLPCFRLNHGKVQSLSRYSKTRRTHLTISPSVRMCSIAASDSPLSTSMYEASKKINANDQTIYSILLQTAETVTLICAHEGNVMQKTAIPVTSLKAGDEVLVRLQGGARHD